MLIPIVNKKDIEHLIITDEIFAFINDKFGSPPNWTRPQGFKSLSKIILEQQVSLASANAHFLKLDSYVKEFSPKEILNLTDQEMRNCQVSRQKSKYLRTLSFAILNGTIDLEEISKLDLSLRRKQLTSIKGIGEWTTDIYLMFCLQEKDIFPFGDIAIINTMKEFGYDGSKEETVLLTEKWQPFRSLAAYFFWHYYLKKHNRNLI